MENGRYFATIPGLKGLWADGGTLEECRHNLIDTLEDWIFISLKEGLPIPALDDVALIADPELELADA
jgi:predicted RNase H-like HicB family nuclease